MLSNNFSYTVWKLSMASQEQTSYIGSHDNKVWLYSYTSTQLENARIILFYEEY